VKGGGGGRVWEEKGGGTRGIELQRMEGSGVWMGGCGRKNVGGGGGLGSKGGGRGGGM